LYYLLKRGESLSDISIDKQFHLKNRSIKNISELTFILETMEDYLYKEHVTKRKNDFSRWIREVFHKRDLAKKITKKSRKQTIRILKHYLKKYDVYETIIIGAGIAGMTAAIYASRKRMKFLIISTDFGGQINLTGPIENYPGFKQTNNMELLTNLESQLWYNNIKMNQGEDVKKIVKQKDGTFSIITSKAEYFSESIILATGARPRKLNVPGEEEMAGKGITYCAICDGPLYKNKIVAIIGGGNAALEAADFLINIAKKIYILNNKDELIANKILVEKITGQKKVEIIHNARTSRILGDKFVNGLKYEQKNREKHLKVSGIFVEIGRIPNTEFVKGLVDIDEDNHIKIDKQTSTSEQGIFAVGDCADGHEYQLIIAAGQGCMALLRAARYLARRHHHAT
jgi:NADH-dependent peroxiredoxin subunit F